VEAVARLTWARCDRLVAEFAESALQLEPAERELQQEWASALRCCAGAPGRCSQTHAGRKPVPIVLNRRPQ